MKPLLLVPLVAAALAAMPAQAADNSSPRLEIYSARGDRADEALYRDFIETTKIQVNRTENTARATLEALQNEGRNSPADVVLLDGMVALAQAQDQGMLEPVQSDALDDAVPRERRAAPVDGGTTWFGFAESARIVVYKDAQAKPQDFDTYEKLAGTKNRGRLCMASASDAANLGLIAAMITHEGTESARTWLRGVKDNLAHAAGGNDTDQIKAVASGQCTIALTSQAALADLMQSDEGADRDIAQSVQALFPNQQAWGTHVDVSGAALVHGAPHAKEARKFLEYLVSESGQNLFANRNNEFPVVTKYRFDNPALKTILGRNNGFRADTTPLAEIAQHASDARQLVDAVGFSQ